MQAVYFEHIQKQSIHLFGFRYAFAGVEGAETLPLEPTVAKVLLLRRLEAPLADLQLVRFASRGRGAADLPLLPAGDVPEGGPGHLPGVLRGLLAD